MSDTPSERRARAAEDQLAEYMDELRQVAEILRAGDRSAIDAAREVMLALDIAEARLATEYQRALEDAERAITPLGYGWDAREAVRALIVTPKP